MATAAGTIIEVKSIFARVGAMDNLGTGIISGEHLDMLLVELLNAGWVVKFVTPYALVDAAHVIHYHLERKS